MAKVIREIDPNRVLIVESAPDSTSASFANMLPIPVANVVYSVHSYSPIDLTHQGVMKWYTKPVTYGSSDGANYNKTDLEEFLESVATFATKYDVPILVGEFGCVRSAPKGSASIYLKDSMDIFNRYGWSWAYHEFRGWPGWDAEAVDVSTGSYRRSMEAPIMNLLIDGIHR
jgi:hypothetical protein